MYPHLAFEVTETEGGERARLVADAGKVPRVEVLDELSLTPFPKGDGKAAGGIGRRANCRCGLGACRMDPAQRCLSRAAGCPSICLSEHAWPAICSVTSVRMQFLHRAVATERVELHHTFSLVTSLKSRRRSCPSEVHLGPSGIVSHRLFSRSRCWSPQPCHRYVPTSDSSTWKPTLRVCLGRLALVTQTWASRIGQGICTLPNQHVSSREQRSCLSIGDTPGSPAPA